MEWLNGKPLDRILAKGTLPLFKALRMMRDLLRIVKDCHEAGYCVGDIHTGNIIVTPDDLPHIIDVDLGAKLTSRTSAEDRAIVCKLFYEITDGPHPIELRSAFPKRRDAVANKYKHTAEMLNALDMLMGRDSQPNGRYTNANRPAG